MTELEQRGAFSTVEGRLPRDSTSFAEQFQNFLELRKTLLLLGISILYFAASCAHAYGKLLWYDEFFMYYISRLPRLSDIWYALSIATTNDPPLNYLLTRASFALFGYGHIAFRLPAIIGFWVMCVCLFHFVAKRYSISCAFVALLFPLTTEAWAYAYEGRPYGVVLACCGMSLVCWAASCENYRRGRYIIALTLSLAIALSSHYFAVILYAPLIAGEVVRTVNRRRIDWPIWVSFALSASPLLLFLPLMKASRQYSAHIWFGVEPSSILGTYSFLLEPAIAPLLLGATIVCLLRGKASLKKFIFPSLPPHEIAAVFSLVALPVVGFLVGLLVTGTFVPRYALGTVVGLDLLLVAMISRSVHSRMATSAVFAFVFLAFLWVTSVQALKAFTTNPADQLSHFSLKPFDREASLPIALSNIDVFLKLENYGPVKMRPRFVRLIDGAAAIRHTGMDTGELNMAGLRRITALPIIDYNTFVKNHRRFLVYGFLVNRNDWLISQLNADGARTEFLKMIDGASLFLITMPEQTVESASVQQSEKNN